MKLLKVLLLTLISTTLAGCPSMYHGKSMLGYPGGYSEKTVASGLLKVSYRGIGLNTERQLKDYVLFRASVLGKKKNKKFFTIYSSLELAADDVMAFDPEVIQYHGEKTAYAYVRYHNDWQPGDMKVAKIYRRIGKKIGEVKGD